MSGLWYEEAQLLNAENLMQLGTTLIVAPHQDDESLGCGGLIALLRELYIPVHVVFTTDGSLSHPNSKTYPAYELMQLREKEAIAALKILGVDELQVTFLRLQDGSLPATDQPGFIQAANAVQQVLLSVQPHTIVTPWQRDPHPDHRATWQMVNHAIGQTGAIYRRLEYLVWLWERAADDDLPKPGETKVWKADITPVNQRKQEAIRAHLSQTTRMIDDDPEGFILSPEVLAHFNTGQEIFVERTEH
ncbi:PIG-L family deacetylase [Mucilaginibacter koreensis]